MSDFNSVCDHLRSSGCVVRYTGKTFVYLYENKIRFIKGLSPGVISSSEDPRISDNFMKAVMDSHPAQLSTQQFQELYFTLSGE